MSNHGVILGKRNTDYVAGTLPHEIRNQSGDWTAYLPKEEWQTNHIQDTMACVSFSALNSIETQIKFLTGIEFNFSDRFTATMSGTTKQGNYLWKVADSIRKDGLVLEREWIMPTNYTWDEYYTAPPIAIIDKAKKFLEQWEVKYEWIDFSKESLIYHLKHAPIQVVIPGHAVLAFYSNEQITRYFDSYDPFIKERAEPFIAAMKIVLTKSNMTITKDQLELLYQAIFRRHADPDAWGYEGMELEDFLRIILASGEYQAYKGIFEGGKDIEEWAKK